MKTEPIVDTTLTMVVRNEAHRLDTLLPYLRPWFEEIVVGVQDSDDETLGIAESLATKVVRDRPRGFGDATMPKVQRAVTRTWCLRIDADERPTEDLLTSLRNAGRYCVDNGLDGLWLPFRSWIEDIEWEQPHSHLRFWKRRIEWPPMLHSRPMTERTQVWPTGFVEHRKSLDEHVAGYLGYMEAGRGHVAWTEHNKLMLRAAVEGVAAVRGWADIEDRSWWPMVLSIIYGGRRPAEPAPIPEP